MGCRVETGSRCRESAKRGVGDLVVMVTSSVAHPAALRERLDHGDVVVGDLSSPEVVRFEPAVDEPLLVDVGVGRQPEGGQPVVEHEVHAVLVSAQVITVEATRRQEAVGTPGHTTEDDELAVIRRVAASETAVAPAVGDPDPDGADAAAVELHQEHPVLVVEVLELHVEPELLQHLFLL